MNAYVETLWRTSRLCVCDSPCTLNKTAFRIEVTQESLHSSAPSPPTKHTHIHAHTCSVCACIGHTHTHTHTHTQTHTHTYIHGRMGWEVGGVIWSGTEMEWD